jgi:hypothetical protein
MQVLVHSDDLVEALQREGHLQSHRAEASCLLCALVRPVCAWLQCHASACPCSPLRPPPLPSPLSLRRPLSSSPQECFIIEARRKTWQAAPLTPRIVFSKLRDISTALTPGYQEDASEFLRLLRDAMQRCCGKQPKETPVHERPYPFSLFAGQLQVRREGGGGGRPCHAGRDGGRPHTHTQSHAHTPASPAPCRTS